MKARIFFVAIFFLIAGCASSQNVILLEDLESITRGELTMNDDAQSCWVGYQGLVYDLTGWLRLHPGGEEAILSTCGTVEQFEQAYDAQHGEKEFLIRNRPIGILED